ncbi:DUF885 domain-containing protein [Vicingaceae bacterium]|nr:DUF885 domain-containing protein [Vicingaceae bacterium]
MKELVYCIFFIGLLACGGQQEKVTNSIAEGQDFEKFKSEFIDSMWNMNPISASFQGMHDFDEKLPIPNEARSQSELNFAEVWLNKLGAFDYSQLTDYDKIDYHLIEDDLKNTFFYLNDFKSGEWNPSSYNLGGIFFQVINFQKHSIEKRLEDLSEKLNHVEAYYAQAKININRPTEVHTNLAIQQLDGSKTIFNKTLLDSLNASSKDEKFKQAFTDKVDKAIVAIDDYKNFLQVNYINKLADSATFISFRIGKDLYSKKFDAEIQSAYSANEVFEAAVEEKGDLHEKMFRLSDMLWEKYFGDVEKPGGRFDQIQMVINEVAKSHVHRDSFMTSIRQQIPELVAFVNENDLITLDTKKPLVVRETPEYMRGFTGASISTPGPYDADAETYYNVTPLDHYNPEEAESYLKEYNNYTFQILNIHEAIPGHYTQLVFSNQSHSLIKSIMGNGAMIEGWAVYAERMMLEAGYGGDQLEMGLMYYKWNLRTVCNTILDYGIQMLDYTEADAMQLLMREAFQEKSEAEGKWRRARLSQVQLCSYFSGYYEIMQLREELQEKMSEEFDLKKFHEEFLSYGSAPVKYIRKLMLRKLELSRNQLQIVLQPLP